ncbi:YraN family protein [Gephyromycinifex aptenodytis]|uniref:YraN family protein n=1 Tax=Gephyromycinifex aptenodytis TaxID=2716227 RepID=UPI0014464780|nr:YraN family protein [Gephyromycinifex aptenodytis]
MAKTSPTRALGEYGERLARRYLSESGLVVLDQNWRCEHGEIDVVASEGDTLVVCEVKTRRRELLGPAVEAVAPTKAARLRRLAGCWIEAHPQRERTRDVRIDVIGILRPDVGPARIDHLRGVQA